MTTNNTVGSDRAVPDEFEDLVRASFDAVAGQARVADHLDPDRVSPVVALSRDDGRATTRNRSVAVVGIAAAVLVAVVVGAGVVRSSVRPDAVATPGASVTAPAPATTVGPETGTWPATPTRYCLGYVDVLNARPQLDFSDTAGRDRFMDAMAQLSGANVRTAWQDRSALVPIPNASHDVGLAQPVADSAMFMCLTRDDGPDASHPSGHYVLASPASADAVWPEHAPDVPAPEMGTTIPPGSGEALWPTEAPPDYCSGWQHYLDVQMRRRDRRRCRPRGSRAYTTQLAAIAAGDLGPSWTQLRDLWTAPGKAGIDDTTDGSRRSTSTSTTSRWPPAPVLTL